MLLKRYINVNFHFEARGGLIVLEILIAFNGTIPRVTRTLSVNATRISTYNYPTFASCLNLIYISSYKNIWRIFMNIEEIKKELRKRLSEKRYNHSVGTMIAAKKLAKVYGEDEETAAFAGLIHDIAKELTKEEIEEYVKKYDIKIDEIEKRQVALLHAKLGACIAKEEFGASEKVQNAILYHTTGNVKMDRFAKIIYVADKIEETRCYMGVDERRKLAIEDLDTVILDTLSSTIEKSINLGRLIHPDTTDLRNYLIIQKNFT